MSASAPATDGSRRQRSRLRWRSPPTVETTTAWLLLNPACQWEIDLDRFEELELPPAAETLTLVAQLRARLVQGSGKAIVSALTTAVSTVVPSYPLLTPGTLVGQEAALSALDVALTAVGSGEATVPRLILLAGEAGMGKTRLLGETARLAQDAGLLVLAGGCYEQEGRLPYGPIHDALPDFVRAQPESACCKTVSRPNA